LLSAAVLAGFAWPFFAGRTIGSQSAATQIAKTEPLLKKDIEPDEPALSLGKLKLSRELKQP
jgi:hypothetical protein